MYAYGYAHDETTEQGEKKVDGIDEKSRRISSGSSLSVTSSLSNEANTNLIAHNNDRLPLRTSSLSEETKTNLIAHNNSGSYMIFLSL